MAYRYFRTKRKATQAAEKLRRAEETGEHIIVNVERTPQGTGMRWHIEPFCCYISQATMDDILSRPMKRKGEK